MVCILVNFILISIDNTLYNFMNYFKNSSYFFMSIYVQKMEKEKDAFQSKKNDNNKRGIKLQQKLIKNM